VPGAIWRRGLDAGDSSLTISQPGIPANLLISLLMRATIDKALA
jgi:hypothetical protein